MLASIGVISSIEKSQDKKTEQAGTEPGENNDKARYG